MKIQVARLVKLFPFHRAPRPYQVSLETGFLPTKTPLDRLSSVKHAPWENIFDQLPSLISASQVRASIIALPVLNCDELATVEEYRRAYAILSLLTNAYIWNGPSPSDYLPPCIVVPLLEVANVLHTKPLVTYAAIVLWNFRIRFHTPSTHNVEALGTFTGSEDESWFVAIMVAIETQGGKCIALLLKIISAKELKDDESLFDYLEKLHQRLQQIQKTLLRLYERCSPDVLYHRIRPYHAGFGGTSNKELPKRVRYVKDFSELGSTPCRQFIGGSGAQSTLLQCFDIILGVQHVGLLSDTAGTITRSLVGKGLPSDSNGDIGFQSRMREYMPGPHKQFLKKLSEYPSVRGYLQTRPANPSSTAAFSRTIASVCASRSAHIQIATRYIIIPARSEERAKVQRNGISNAQEKAGYGQETIMGTGGTSTLPLLRRMRDETSGVGTR
ncbi:Indoleamine 2,3-dioxygenase [Lophiotrema nucula]|uniref:Indoleamine 2,3-dioxygenase n=1 Tax=Lophiotrema nucula TaxID=690887 RepID=A0A6A5ZF76_9PLEO|nr:Indoleamine 2,3-dioxygenase [Lophiotrema nucula]